MEKKKLTKIKRVFNPEQTKEKRNKNTRDEVGRVANIEYFT